MYNNEDSAVIRLLSRNEGKLKRFESCYDLKAWRHDAGSRCRYLKQWIRSDMPTCVVPPRVLTEILLRNIYKSCGQAIPRCNPCCKSKAVLESICLTCEVIRHWFIEYNDFDRYFEEEEYETSHWPCERCVEPLKSVNMFWKIISERIFNVPSIKTTKIEDMPINNKSNVRNVVKNWQNDMMEKLNCAKKLIYSPDVKKEKNDQSVDCCFCDCKTKGTCTIQRKLKKVSRYASVKVKTNDKDTDAPEFLCKMIMHYEQRLNYLEQEVEKKDKETEKLLSENNCLKSKVDTLEKIKVKSTTSEQNFYKRAKCNSVVPTPYGEVCNNFGEIDSEMIITMKKCADKNFKHISLLQVLHKSNQPISSDQDIAELCQKKEDPVELLRKVQSAFGMFVRREMVIANGRRSPREQINIDASSSVQRCCEDLDKDKIRADKNKTYTAQYLTDIETNSNFDLVSDSSDLETFTCHGSTLTSSK